MVLFVSCHSGLCSMLLYLHIYKLCAHRMADPLFTSSSDVLYFGNKNITQRSYHKNPNNIKDSLEQYIIWEKGILRSDKFKQTFHIHIARNDSSLVVLHIHKIIKYEKKVLDIHCYKLHIHFNRANRILSFFHYIL